jgi:hypothetical protein
VIGHYRGGHGWRSDVLCCVQCARTTGVRGLEVSHSEVSDMEPAGITAEVLLHKCTGVRALPRGERVTVEAHHRGPCIMCMHGAASHADNHG